MPRDEESYSVPKVKYLDDTIYSDTQAETRDGGLKPGYAPRPGGGYGKVAIVQGNIPDYQAETRDGGLKPGYEPATGGQFIKTSAPPPTPAPVVAAPKPAPVPVPVQVAPAATVSTRRGGGAGIERGVNFENTLSEQTKRHNAMVNLSRPGGLFDLSSLYSPSKKRRPVSG